MAFAEQAAARRPGYGLVVVFAILTVVAGAGLGVAVGMGLRFSLLVAGLIAPFVVGVTLARPHFAVIVYVALVYADLLSILVRYEGLPPLSRFVGIGLLVAVLGYRLIIYRTGLATATMTWWLVAYGLLLAAGLMYARSPDLVVPELIEFARSFLTYLVVINSLTSLPRIRWALWGLLALGVVLASLTVLQTVTGNFDNEFGGLAQAKITGITEQVSGYRPAGTIGDANYYGQSLLIVLPIGMYLASRAIRPVARAAGLAACLMITAAIIFTYSRGDAIALGVLLVAAVIYKRPKPIFFLGGLAALAITMSLLPADYYARLSGVLDVFGGNSQAVLADSSLRGRAGAATAAIAMFADHPFLGVGRNNYPLYELDYIEGTNLASKSQGIPPHDLYLEVASEQGVVGIIVMGGILILAFRSLWQGRRKFLAAGDASHAELTVWLGIGLFSYLVSSLFLHGAFLYMLWLQVALITALLSVSLTRSLHPRQPAITDQVSVEVRG